MYIENVTSKRYSHYVLVKGGSRIDQMVWGAPL